MCTHERLKPTPRLHGVDILRPCVEKERKRAPRERKKETKTEIEPTRDG